MKKQLLSLSLLFLLSSIVLLSCKKDDSSGPTCADNNSNWLRNGHKFVYANDPIYTFFDSLYVDINEAGSGVFKSSTYYDAERTQLSGITYLQPCGNSIYQAISASMAGKMEVYRMDGNVGDAWTSTMSSTGGMTITNANTITAKNVSVTVPAGTFSCIKIHTVSVPSNPLYATVTTDFYLDKDYGPIEADGSTVHYELAYTNF